MTHPFPSDPLENLTDEQRISVIKSGFQQKLPPAGVLFHQGEAATRCFLVTEGRLKLCKLNEQGKEMIIRYVRAGEWTAAVSVLKNGRYPVTAQAIEVTRLTGWDRKTVLQLLRRYPDIAIHLIEILIHRIDDIQNRYQEIAMENVERRIARTVLRLMRHAGVKTAEGIFIDMTLGRQDIADYTGTTIFTVSRTLSVWEKKGWIRSVRERITVTDPHSLVTFTENG